MITLIQRHIKLFFRDKASVFFSLFSVFIVILLYFLFLSENIMTSLPKFKNQKVFVFLWMFAGIIAVNTATAVLGAFGKFIEDKVSRKSEDFLITHIAPRTLAYSYILYAFIIGFSLTLLLLAFGYIYLFIQFGISLKISLSLLIIIVLSILMHTLLFYLITLTLKTSSAFSGLSTIVGTLIGFLAGIYIPIGILPTYLQKVITLFPTTQTAVLLRDLLMDDILEPIQENLPQDVYNELRIELGIKLQWGNEILTNSFSWGYVICCIVVLIGLVIIVTRKPKRGLSLSNKKHVQNKTN